MVGVGTTATSTPKSVSAELLAQVYHVVTLFIKNAGPRALIFIPVSAG